MQSLSDLDLAQAAAVKYRTDNARRIHPIGKDGYVLINSGIAYGWSLHLDTAPDVSPGVYAIGIDGTTHQYTDHDKWIVIVTAHK